MWARISQTLFGILVIGGLAVFGWGHPAFAQNNKQLKIALLVSSGTLRAELVDALGRFESLNPEEVIVSSEFEQEIYKQNLPHWLAAPKSPYDVIFVFAGGQLNHFAREKLVLPIDDVWDAYALHDQFSEGTIESVKVDDKIYALPYSYYNWGVYYRRSLFQQLNLAEPKTWAEFVAVGELMKSKQITPLIIGSANNWPLAGWFDYLNLRINGLTFHKNLVAGHESFLDPRTVKVFTLWKELIDKGWFPDNAMNMTWRDSLPLVSRKIGGMYLMGSFLIPALPENVRTDMAFFPFPVIDPNIDSAENAPIDAMAIPAKAENVVAAKKLLAFMARPEVQRRLNDAVGMVSPNVQAGTSTDPLIQNGAALLNNTAGFAHFFDRDADPRMVEPALAVFAQFMKNPDVNQATKSLEDLRLGLRKSR